MHVGAIPSLYEPINEYKAFAPHIGIVDGPFEYVSVFGTKKIGWPFTTRMTVVQLANGDLFLHSPIAYDPALAHHLQGMGIIRHLVSPNRGHYAHIGEWARAFPEAVTWASPRVRERARSQRIDVRFVRNLGPYAPPEWCDEVDQTIIPGAVLDEVVFFHRASKTLILADTIVNLEPDKIGRLNRFIARLAGICAPCGGMSPDIRLAFWPSRRKLRPALERVLSWQPERIIVSHGRCFDIDGSAAIERAFNWALSRRTITVLTSNPK